MPPSMSSSGGLAAARAVRRVLARAVVPAPDLVCEERPEEVAEPRQVLGVAPVLEADSASARAPMGGERVAAGGASALVLVPVGAELVVQLPLLGVREDVIRLVEGLEARFRLRRILVHIRVVLARQLAEVLLDVSR